MMWRVIKRVYAHSIYWLVTLVVSVVTLSVMLLLPNYSVLLSVLLSPVVSLMSKAAFFTSLYGSLATNYTILAASSVVAIALLFGVNAALLLFYIRKSRSVNKISTTRTATVGGLVAAVLGIGCAACGSAVIAIVLQFIGVGWLMTYLPLHGAEFGLLGVVLLFYTTYTLAKKIHDPQVCPA